MGDLWFGGITIFWEFRGENGPKALRLHHPGASGFVSLGGDMFTVNSAEATHTMLAE